jgi:trehalose 6-phosphate synthase
MTDAVLVNPHDLDGMAAAMDEARSMPRAERRDRHRSLMQAVEDTGIARWTARCLEDLAASG